MTSACIVCASKPDKRFHFYFYDSSGLLKIEHAKKEDTVQLAQMHRLIWASSIRTYYVICTYNYKTKENKKRTHKFYKILFYS